MSFPHSARPIGTTSGSTNHPLANSNQMPLNPPIPTRAKSTGSGVLDISKQSGRDATSSTADPKESKQQLISQLRKLQVNLATLQGLAGLESQALSDDTFHQTEEVLFDSRSVCRGLSAALKQLPSNESAGLQPVFLALQSSIEKAATLLLAKHKLNAEENAHAGSKRKGSTQSLGSTQNAKRAKCAVISKPVDPETLRPQKHLDPAEQAVQQVDTLATQALSLQMLQGKLTTNAQGLSQHTSAHSSGTSTPSRLLSARPHNVFAPHVTDFDDTRTDDGPMSSRTDDSMSSEADSEHTMQHRQGMIANLVDNINKLRGLIAAEKATKAAPSPQQEEKDEYDDDVAMMDSSGILDESKTQAPLVAPSSVPKLDLASLTSTCSALEELLKKSLASMADLAAIQERELRKKQLRKDVVGKRAGARNDAASIFPAPQASSFSGREFDADGDALMESPAVDNMVHTEAARALDAMDQAVRKKSDVPRVKQTVFGSSTRFPEDVAKKKLTKQQERKALYERYNALYAETKLALQEAERKMKQEQMGTSIPHDPLDATRPRLVQNVVMGQDPALKEKMEPRSLEAKLAHHEREQAERRQQALGPGAYEIDDGLAKTLRRVTGVTSWGPGPPSALAGEESEDLAPTQRFVTKLPASGTLGPGAHVVSESLVTKRVPGPAYKAPTDEETEQHRRAREMLAETERKREEFEMAKDFEELDATVRRRVPGAIVLPSPEKDPSLQQSKKDRLEQERLRKVRAEYEAREEKLQQIAATRFATQEALKTQRREEFLKQEDEKLEKTARLLAAGLGPDGSPPPEEININYEYLLPRKPAFRYAAPKTLQDLQKEGTKHGASARKRSAAQLAKQEKQEQEQGEKLARIEAQQRRASAMRSSSALNLSTMTGRPEPKGEDKRDYDLAKSKDFLAKRTPGDNWARASARPVAEPAFDPEIDDVIGGEEGDVLDLDVNRADKWTKPKLRGHAFGPATGPDPTLGLQTLSDTELDYANGVEEEREVLYPNLDFGRKRQGAGGAVPFARQVLGGTRSEGESDNEYDEFPYLAEGNVAIDPKYSAVEPKVRNGRFAVRRKEFMELHRLAKEREAARERENAGELIINPHLSTGTLRHKPGTSLAFSARHDTGGTADDELDDMEGLGEFYDGPRRTRSGPAAYKPKYGFKDANTPKADFTRSTGRPNIDDDDPLLREEDMRDFMGGILAPKKDPSRVTPNTALPGASFARSTGRKDEQEDYKDFPETTGEGDRLDLNPRKSMEGRIKGGLNMSLTTGRTEKDDLDIEADEVRLDLNNTDGLKRKKVLGAHSFGRSTGRDSPDELGQPEGDVLKLDPLHFSILPRAPHASFADAARFDVEDPEGTQGGQQLDVRDDITRRNLRAAFFPDAPARPEPAGLEDAQTMLDPKKPFDHIPQVDFTHGAQRGMKLPPLEDKLALVPNDELVHPSPPAVSFTKANRPAAQAQSKGSDQRLALDPQAPGSSSGVVFGDERRPGQGLQFTKQEGSVLHPEHSDEYMRKHHPEWSFATERRFDGIIEEYAGYQKPLQLNPDRSAIEPKSPAAFFPDSLRKSKDFDPAAASEVLALMPNMDAILTRHPSLSLSRESRFPVDVVDDRPKQLNLHPDVSATRPKSPAASVLSRSKQDDPHVEGNRLQLYPKHPSAASPSAHITDSLRGTGFGGLGGSQAYHNPLLKLDPNYSTQHTRSPAHRMGERLYDPTYVPSNMDMQAYRERQAKVAAMVERRPGFPDDEYMMDLLENISPRAGDAPQVSRTAVLGPSRARSSQPSSSTSYPDQSDEFSIDETSFNLPDAGVVGNTASLVRARREKQAVDAAKAEKILRRSHLRSSTDESPIVKSRLDDETDELAALSRGFGSDAGGGSLKYDDPSSSPVASILSPSRRVQQHQSSSAPFPEPQRSSSPILASSPSPTGATRKTVKFAEMDEEQEAPVFARTIKPQTKPKKGHPPSRAAPPPPRSGARTPATVNRAAPSRPTAASKPAAPAPQRSASPPRPILKQTKDAAVSALPLPRQDSGRGVAEWDAPSSATSSNGSMSQRGLSEYLKQLRVSSSSKQDQ